MSQYPIRLATLEDVDILSQISGDWFRAEFDGTCTLDDMDQFVSECFSAEDIHTEIQQDPKSYMIMSDGDRPIAYARMTPHMPASLENVLRETPMELKRFYIDPEYKGTGIAQQMMQYCLDETLHRGYDTIVLSVWEYNVRAQQFYKRFGFRDTHIQNDFPIASTPQTDLWYLLRLDT